MVLSAIVKFFVGEVVSEHLQALFEISGLFLRSDRLIVKLNGLATFSVLTSHLEEFHGFGELIPIIIETIQRSIEYSDRDFAALCNSVCDLIGTPQFIELFQTCLALAHHAGLSATRLMMVVTALANAVDEETFESVFEMHFSILCQAIEETDTLPFDQLDISEQLFMTLPRPDAFQFFLSTIMEAIDADVARAAAAILLLKVLFATAPDCVQQSSEAVVSIIQAAMNSDSPLLVQAACFVMESFDETVSGLRTFCVSLLQ
jgi:hypothetical protein